MVRAKFKVSKIERTMGSKVATDETGAR